ncbi:MAG TPA: adenylyltransferase/cytidyltransferase family protein [Candidatus Saccharimonadales bacterium]|nr:adenylyltransferase/cytidyltransferase family protein [Candidatus Saccharimonadales bacterium]
MIVALSKLPEIRRLNKNKTIVLASGVFDLMHYGHVKYLENMKKYGDVAVVLVKPDARVKRFKSKDRPIIPEQDRLRMVNAIKGVDYAFIGPDNGSDMENDEAYSLIFAKLKPDIFYSTNPEWAKLAKHSGPKIVIRKRIVFGSFDSTTAIIDRIRDLK